MTLLIAVLIIYGLGLNPWLYLVATVIWAVQFYWREKFFLTLSDQATRTGNMAQIIRDRMRR